MNSKPLYELHGARVLEYRADGPLIRTAPEATDLIGEALQCNAHWVLLPTPRLTEAFFELKSGLAGEVVQKFTNYQIALAIVGEVPPQAAASRSLQDFMREANRGRALWFVSDRDEFVEKLQTPVRGDGLIMAGKNPQLHIRAATALTPPEIEGLSQVLIDCVEGGASVSFMLPMTRAKADLFWRGVGDSAARGERVVYIAEDTNGIVGTAQIVWAQPENQPHRADVAKMLVHRRGRRQGVGAALLGAAEQGALQRGKTLLVLDTVTGGDGERLYATHGWQRCGEIPNYALWPNGSPCATTVFYKSLRGTG